MCDTFVYNLLAFIILSNLLTNKVPRSFHRHCLGSKWTSIRRPGTAAQGLCSKWTSIRRSGTGIHMHQSSPPTELNSLTRSLAQSTNACPSATDTNWLSIKKYIRQSLVSGEVTSDGERIRTYRSTGHVRLSERCRPVHSRSQHIVIRRNYDGIWKKFLEINYKICMSARGRREVYFLGALKSEL